MPAVPGVDDARDDVLAGMLLHQVEPVGVVHDALHGLANGQGRSHPMEDPLPLLMDMEHLHAAQGAPVGGLSAALGVEGGAVQLDLKALLRFRTIHNNGGKLCQTAVGVV